MIYDFEDQTDTAVSLYKTAIIKWESILSGLPDVTEIFQFLHVLSYLQREHFLILLKKTWTFLKWVNFLAHTVTADHFQWLWLTVYLHLNLPLTIHRWLIKQIQNLRHLFPDVKCQMWFNLQQSSVCIDKSGEEDHLHSPPLYFVTVRWS